jgi:hypothetical protein
LSPRLGFGYEDPKGEINERGKNIPQIYQKLHFSLLSRKKKKNTMQGAVGERTEEYRLGA